MKKKNNSTMKSEISQATMIAMDGDGDPPDDEDGFGRERRRKDLLKMSEMELQFHSS